MDRLYRAIEQFSAGDEEVATCHGRQVFRREGEYDRPNSGPVHLARAHRTRLATCIDDAPAELVRREFLNCRRNQIRLRMSGWIVIGGDRISSSEHNRSIQNQHSSERVVSGDPGFTRQLDGLGGKRQIGVSGYHRSLMMRSAQ
jgi:hypothetical protein